MNRRKAIGNIFVLSIGSTVLPSCGSKDESLVILKNISLTGSEEKMLIQLADSIIPKTGFIGAKDLKTHGFTLMMVDECYEPAKQKKYITGLKEFDKIVKNKFSQSFTDCTADQKIAWLTVIEKKQGIPEDAYFFYETTKRYTIQAFTTSREYMTGVLKYNMVPGSNFKGCVPVKKA